MAASPYASPMGRLKVRSLELLPKETLISLAQAKDLLDVQKTLEGTPYGPEIAGAAASYAGAARLEVAINRLFVRRCRGALDSAPFAGKAVVGAYLRRWDVQNLALIFAAKANGRRLEETETFLVSSREFPAGLFAGAMTLDDFRQLLALPTVEAIAQQLVRYGYGGTLLGKLEAYQRTRDIFPLLQALDEDYYARLSASVRSFQGDEWNIGRFIRTEIDVRNALLLLKGKDGNLPFDALSDRFLAGGDLTKAAAGDAYAARGVPELVQALQGRFRSLPEGLEAYREHGTLTRFETALVRARAVEELTRLARYPLSLAIAFAYLLRSELERADLRRIIYGRQYGVAAAGLAEELVVPKL